MLVRRLNSNDPKLVTIFWTSTFEGSKLVLRFLDDKEDYNRLSQVSITSIKVIHVHTCMYMYCMCASS